MIYNYPYAYVLNLIKIHSAKKNLTFTLMWSRKNLQLLKLLYKYGLILTYRFTLNKKNQKLIQIFLFYYKFIPLCKNFKLISKPSKAFYVSLKALQLINKRTKTSIFVLSTTRGLISHHEAIKYRIGGLILGFFSV